MTEHRIVVDTNVLVSAFIYPHSVPGRAYRKAYEECTLVFTEATLDELRRVLQKKKLQKLFTAEEQDRLVDSVEGLADIIPVTRPIKACRDPNDDKFLDAAVHGGASHLITGDADLLMLHPFMDVVILTPAAFLAAA